MRAVTLARTAADAEILLIRREMTTAFRRAAYAAVAAVFALGVLIELHVLAFDLVVALICLLMARSSVDPTADELRGLRDQCIAEVRRSMGGAAIGAASRFLGRKQILGVILTILMTRFFRHRE